MSNVSPFSCLSTYRQKHSTAQTPKHTMNRPSYASVPPSSLPPSLPPSLLTLCSPFTFSVALSKFPSTSASRYLSISFSPLNVTTTTCSCFCASSSPPSFHPSLPPSPRVTLSKSTSKSDRLCFSAPDDFLLQLPAPPAPPPSLPPTPPPKACKEDEKGEAQEAEEEEEEGVLVAAAAAAAAALPRPEDERRLGESRADKALFTSRQRNTHSPLLLLLEPRGRSSAASPTSSSSSSGGMTGRVGFKARDKRFINSSRGRGP